MRRVVIAENALEPSSWTAHEVLHVGAFIRERFPTWPTTARIYRGQVAQSNDVTPTCDADVAALEGDEPVIVVVYPGTPLVIILIVAVLLVVAAIIIAILLRPKPNLQSPSPNNQLANKQNSARPGGRICDIYGTVRSVPDLVAANYSVFVNNVEVQYAQMCIGRGSFTIGDMRDDVTPITQITGSTVEVWGPYETPATPGASPIELFGPRLAQPLLAMSHSNVINGQELTAPNANAYASNGSYTIVFSGTDTISIVPVNPGSQSAPDLTQYFQIGDLLTVADATITQGSLTLDLNGTFTVLSVTSTQLVLANPGATDPDWNRIPDWPGQTSGQTGAIISSTSEKWVGPYILTQPVDLVTGDPTQNTVICNFVCVNGLYTLDTSNNQHGFNVQVEIGVTQIDPLTLATIGPEYLYFGVIYGSSTSKLQRACTIQVTTPFTGPCQVRAKRNTNTLLKFSGTVNDTVQWRDFYAGSPITVNNYGNVTTLYCATFATAAALTPTEQKLNCLVTRNIPVLNGTILPGYDMADLDPSYPTFGPTNYLPDVLCAMAFDRYIGALPTGQVDVAQVSQVAASIVSYFDTPEAAWFCATFDQGNTSFEEMVVQLGQATFSTAYRRGSVIKLYSEQKTANSTLLFNHRNKLPGSETRTVSFGSESSYDGVTYDFISPIDDTLQTYYIPIDRSAVSPSHISSTGVRSLYQAYLNAWRIWNKLQFQTTQAEFDATAEAALCVLNDRILVADNTRGDTQDGEVEAQDVLQLTLSQPVAFREGQTYTIYVQHFDGTVEGIPITLGTDEYQVVLSRPPAMPLVLVDTDYARTTYVIEGSKEARPSPMLVTAKTPKDAYVTTMTAVNYDDRYYQNDQDVRLGRVTSNLPPPYGVIGGTGGAKVPPLGAPPPKGGGQDP